MHRDQGDADLRSAFAHGRLSPQRRALAEAVEAFEGAFTVEDLAAAARVRLPRLAVATAYRAVAAMAASGHIVPVGSADGSVLYARCRDQDAPHHHHAVCERCGTVVCLYGVCTACADGVGGGAGAKGEAP